MSRERYFRYRQFCVTKVQALPVSKRGENEKKDQTPVNGVTKIDFDKNGLRKLFLLDNEPSGCSSRTCVSSYSRIHSAIYNERL
jgi:hypothetical protein